MKKKEVYKVPSCNNGCFAKQLSISNFLSMMSIFLINLRNHAIGDSIGKLLILLQLMKYVIFMTFCHKTVILCKNKREVIKPPESKEYIIKIQVFCLNIIIFIRSKYIAVAVPLSASLSSV